jgi:hypothetical protein
MTRARSIADIGDDVAGGGSLVTTSSPSLGRRNLIINGAMQVWQRATSVTHPYAYCADRWQNRTGSTVTWSRSTTVPDGFVYSNDCDAACSIATAIELDVVGNQCQYTDGTSFTLTVWSTQVPTALVCFADDYGPSNAVTFGNGNSVAMTSTGETSNGFTKYILVVTAPSSINAGNTNVFVRFTWSTAVKFTGVQFEKGAVATPFEYRSYGEELALCQRYYIDFGGQDFLCTFIDGNTTTRVGTMVQFPVSMRSAPSMSYSTPNVGSSLTQGTSTESYWSVFNSDSANRGAITYIEDVIADAEL